MKYLIVGLGNMGDEYVHTRHNIGWDVADALVNEAESSFSDSRLAYKADVKIKGRLLVVIKPTTYMNLSGKAVNYWMQKENIPVENVIILVDDLALPLGSLRLRPNGSDAGHNGLRNIHETLGHQNYTRLRIGIGNNFAKGRQVEFVLGKWDSTEWDALQPRIKTACNIVKSFVTIGLERTMTAFNNK
jgi:PTH1 family peptidyl-tRNA hydrolase